jgi:acetyl esterase
MIRHTAEPTAPKATRASSKTPFLREPGPDRARTVRAGSQTVRVVRLGTQETSITVPAEVGDVPVRIIKPAGTAETLPAVLYMHGGGWIPGNAGRRDRLVRELAVRTGGALVRVEYDRSPEAQYQFAIEQAHATARWIVQHGSTHGLDGTHLVVAGDWVGANMATALAILARRRGDVTVSHQSLYYPVVGADQDTSSYREYADGPCLTATPMAWSWDACLPDPTRRSEFTAPPPRSCSSELAGPGAFVIIDENDVLRDRGEAYARKLTEAGVRTASVRFSGTLNDFLMLSPGRGTAVATTAFEQAIPVLRKALGMSCPPQVHEGLPAAHTSPACAIPLPTAAESSSQVGRPAFSGRVNCC